MTPGLTDRAHGAGGWHCLAVSEEGQAYSWGGNEYMQCGVDSGDKRDIILPVACLPRLKICQVAAGGMHSLALTVHGEVWQWGQPLREYFSEETRRPAKIEGIKDVKKVAAGAFHNLAVTRTGEVRTGAAGGGEGT